MQFMKIDVEGFEAEVLKGAAQLLDNHNVWFIAAGG
jgi:FkbM family methyltransferase